MHGRCAKARGGQAMLETVLAVVFLTTILFGLFALSRMAASRILLDHAAARAARAKAVGFNDFMCRKSARAAMIPVAGKRLWPEIEGIGEAARVPIYLSAENEATARGVLEYEWWNTSDISVSAGGLNPSAKAKVVMHTDEFSSSGEAEMENHYPLYMEDGGF